MSVFISCLSGHQLGTCGLFWPVHCEQEVVRSGLYFQADAIKAQRAPLSSSISSDAATLEVTYSRWCGCKWLRCGSNWVRLEQPALDLASLGNKIVLSRWDFWVYLFLWDTLTYSTTMNDFPSLSQIARWHALYVKSLFHIIDWMNFPVKQIKNLISCFHFGQIPIPDKKIY